MPGASKSAARRSPSGEPAIRWGTLQACRPHQLNIQDLPVRISGNTLAILLPHLQLELEPSEQKHHDYPLHAVLTAELAVPVTLPADGIFIGYKTEARGAVATSPEGRATLFLDIGGTASLIEFPFGQERSGDFARSVFSLQSGGTDDTPPEHPAAPMLHLVLTLVVQRQTAEARALLAVDSLDILALFNGRRPADADAPSGASAAPPVKS